MTATLTPLTQAEQDELLRLAREAIGAALGCGEAPVLHLETPALLTPGAAFVSIYCDGQLRGCVGTMTADDPLHTTITTMACSAACHDIRFPPLTAALWPRVGIEISRLGTPQPAKPEEIVLGRHGVYVVRGTARGVLLPQVGARPGWSRERLLSETCHKAGLGSDMWRNAGTELFIFVAEVFSESEKGA